MITKTAPASSDVFSIKIVDSQATDRTNIDTGLAFRGWNYAHILIKLFLTAIDEEVYINTGCGVTLADRLWLLALLPKVKIRRMPKALRVKGLGIAMHDTDEYVLIPMYIPDVKEDGTKVLCRITREIHLIGNLKAHMLIENDIVDPKQIVIDINRSKAVIDSCDITADISCRQRSQQYTRRAVHAKEALTILPSSKSLIRVTKLELLDGRDFLFEPIEQANITLYAHIVDSKLYSILAKNESRYAVQISRKHRLDMLAEVDYENIYFAEHLPDFSEPPAPLKRGLRKPSTNTSWIKKAVTIATTAAFSISATINSLLPEQKSSAATNVLAKETKLNNEVMIYRDTKSTATLSNLIAEFPTVWKNEGFVKLPQKDWIKITLRDD